MAEKDNHTTLLYHADKSIQKLLGEIPLATQRETRNALHVQNGGARTRFSTLNEM